MTTKDVTDNNISRIYLTKLIKEDKIERVSRGVYIKKNVLVDEFIVLQGKSKYAIYSNTTALYLHGFSNRIPIRYDITIKSGYKGSLQREDNVNLFYTKKELLDFYIRELTKSEPGFAEKFREIYYHFVLVRLLQAMGAFGLRGLHEGKPHFIDSIVPGLQGIRTLFESGKLEGEYPEIQYAIRMAFEKYFVPLLPESKE